MKLQINLDEKPYINYVLNKKKNTINSTWTAINIKLIILIIFLNAGHIML